jgi:hypothetical protein
MEEHLPSMHKSLSFIPDTENIINKPIIYLGVIYLCGDVELSLQ